MTSTERSAIIFVRCPRCGREGRGPDFLSDWDGKTYLLTCGHRSHLDEKKGGARTWMVLGNELPDEKVA